MASKLNNTSPEDATSPYVHRHLRFGWWSLLVFLTLGLLLETMHGFKVGWYLDVSNQTRRLMWTLGHAHGTLLALVNLALGFTVKLLPEWGGPSLRVASWWLIGASVLMPFGFLLGGLVVYGGDPGVGIVFVAIGGLMLFVAVLSAARGMTAAVSLDAKKSPGRKKSRR